jgi:Protein of unknown function (DUF2490)
MCPSPGAALAARGTHMANLMRFHIPLLLCATTVAFGQTAVQRVHANNAHGWFMYFGDHPVAKTKWGVHLEGQWRRHDVATQWQQLLLRPAVNYTIHPNITLTAGYGFIKTHRYGEFPVAQPFPEHRFYQQAQITQKIGNVNTAHRYRLEQRFLGEMSPTRQVLRYRHENRFRYMYRVMIPIKGKWSLALYDEVMFNFGKNVAANIFDQNRAYAAAAYQMHKHARLEVGFMEQTLQQRNGRVFENNHTFQVAIYSNLPFGR